MRFAAVALALMAGLTPLQAAASQRADRQSIMARALGAPQGGDDFMFRQAFQQNAQGISDRMFGAVSKVLGGDAPQLNFVPAGTGGVENDFSANLTDRPGFARGTINVDPQAVQWLIDEQNPFHSSAVNAMPHEMAHTRQTDAVLRSTPDAEGGAQAFADLVAPRAASLAGTRYIAGNYDGPYADYAAQAQAKGLAYILGQQFGHAPVSWP